MCQENTQANPFDESSLLVIPAELADRIYNVVHLPQWHPVHLLVELVEVCADLLVVIWAVFVVALVGHGQDRFSIPEVWGILCDISSQFFKVSFQVNHLQSIGDGNS